MEICSENHQEICFEGRDCPLCMALENIDDCEKEISKLNETIENLYKE